MVANKLKFAVLGAGHGGRAMAAYLAAIGCNVNLYNRTPENIRNIQQSGGIFLTYTPFLEYDIFPEGIERLEAGLRHEYSLTPKTEKLVEEDVSYIFGELNIISSDIEEVIKDRDVIMVAVPATGHKYMAEKCAPYLRDGQTILLNPGRFFGAIEFYKIINDHYKDQKPPDVTIAEAQTFIYASRRTKPRSVRILGVKNSVDIAAIPSYKTKNVVNLVGDVYPQFTPTDNVLKTSLGNLGGVFHVPITILNATRIDKKDDFEYYIEGVTEHAASIIEDVDKERLAIAEAMGVEVVSARRWLYQTYGSEGADLYEAIQNTHAYKGIESPGSINHRYIWEDVPTGLVPLSSLGKKLDIPTPLIDSFIHQATSALRKDLNIDFFERGRTMEKLGLGNMSIDEIKEFVETGYK
ncbi:MAG: NAD/NADP octopine/nopaline dehydrogenase family protein [Candidatus Lokiarchaeia archaeon]